MLKEWRKNKAVWGMKSQLIGFWIMSVTMQHLDQVCCRVMYCTLAAGFLLNQAITFEFWWQSVRLLWTKKTNKQKTLLTAFKSWEILGLIIIFCHPTESVPINRMLGCCSTSFKKINKVFLCPWAIWLRCLLHKKVRCLKEPHHTVSAGNVTSGEYGGSLTLAMMSGSLSLKPNKSCQTRNHLQGAGTQWAYFIQNKPLIPVAGRIRASAYL